ncbi:MAG: NrfD/PsrC family molybdoenzyme membrane anchor subunit [Dehalococcoidia bacterium]|nr:NrfD/PsrC family molybdoenzyme membrane anchor subunit [Dehalococcoidia bacterium]
MTWGLYIAIYLFCAGAGAGAFLAAVTAEIYSKEAFKPLIRAGYLISGPLVALGTPFLMLDLGMGLREPLRLLGLLNNPGSVMSIGTVVLSLFMPVAFLFGVMELGWHWPLKFINVILKFIARFRTVLLYVGTILAFSTAIYTGMLIGVVKGVPLWNTPVLPALFFISALSSGLAAAVVFAVLFPSEDRRLMAEHFFSLNQVHSLMVVVELVFVFSWLFIMAGLSVSSGQSVSMLLTGDLAFWFWFGVVFLGIIDPLTIYVYEVILHKPLVGYAMFISDASVLVGGFSLRYLVLAAAIPPLLY